MKRTLSASAASHDHGLWLVALLLLVAVLAPTACVLWFMNQAINTQRVIARQQLAEAYRGQLSLVREKLDAFWEKRAADLDRTATAAAPGRAFDACVRAHLADSAIILDRAGNVAYPLAVPTSFASPADQERIRQAQEHIRDLVQRGEKDFALASIDRQFDAARATGASGESPRLVAADEYLLALHLLPRTDARWRLYAARLEALLNNYGNGALASPQRLFLMDEMRAWRFAFPTYEAERMAQRYLDAELPRPTGAALRLANLAGAWKLSTPSGRVLALYRDATVTELMRPLLAAHVSIVPPGGKAERADHWAPAGSRLPGWQLALALESDADFAAIARRQMTAYVWVGVLAIVTLTVLALIVGRAFLNQRRVARLKTDLVATVSHELKTPVASVGLLIEGLLEDDTLDPVKTREYLQLMAVENVRLSRLIDNFLTFSRMDRNVHRFEYASVHPSAIANAALEAVHGRYPVTLDIAATLPSIQADAGALVTAVLNLLENAAKFTPDDKRITLRIEACGNNVLFSVRDNGIGIAPRERKRIFRRFYQVDRSLSRRAGGCGLGLSIVDFIVRAHGGSVGVESTPGTGSTFTLTIPQARTA